MAQCRASEQENSQIAMRLAGLLEFMAQSMEYPDKSWLTTDHWQLLVSILDELGWTEELKALPTPDDILSEPGLTALQVEYTRLFINAVPHVIAPPYGSIYTDSEGILFGPSAEKTKVFYRQQGYDLRGPNDIPDHLNHELRFLSLMLQDGKFCETEQFLAEFFRPWFCLFRNRVVDESRHPYFPVMMKLIHFFTKEDEEHVNQVNPA
ncbi:molecular chaperone [Desulfuromonas acetoxidans]|uniref:Cytoplasmic chaperone TorD n=1 Tax=Desulfuromonas acetoxidans (strain DSM 684 / 11070) TaxID=281689 RepID=Q1K1P1_DESA6|nr:molecular chaperone TorD family protein [Desulfuromonas acetoxidans]EAT16347.1 cytoplasmic chaperone TorD [Desulfuromonas acetoxidans DSM 684]MBF0645976.1 molecular chaperone TorD family protein [Desulfuromonas acetoxidans]NVD23486.1 molecular chaperone TorD family protein [Desulfuromonas acetoxidans]NVE16128.1 molecular chaperone TorD family protein [Desulfuromonas acetoxidans]